MKAACCLVIGLLGCGDDSQVQPDASTTTDAAPDAHPDAPTDAPGGPVRLADVVVAAPGGGDTSKAVNGVYGAGTAAGGFDVYSLGYTPNVNDSITLAWSNGKLANGAGEDFAVFENPFASGTGVFMDLVIVEVSRDGTTWRAIDHAYANANQSVYVNNPALWTGFAGKTPVLLNATSNPVDPFDRTAAGGDGFDLDQVLGNDDEAIAIRQNGVKFIRLVSAPARVNPATGATYVHEAVSNGADIDGVYGRYVVAQ